ncbi:putative exported protein [Candidatus Rhodobacter oscarellae]|uniref:Putative exported protein n=1 Tax=Candidatus Rhodobacter oscarellae TaxID=1675527 RepID=A0A0J9GT74_9RHOB|nr:putative exported protein [Candidatus Rhodobacter lobularis]
MAAACRDDQVELRGDWGAVRFNVEVADTAAEHAVGLMNRSSMPARSGMIFLYEAPQRVGFWMRNTLIPLDMLFMSADGVVQKIHQNAVPLDETVILGGDNIQYVLEINGGMSARLGITTGTELRHPGVNQAVAAWPCE